MNCNNCGKYIWPWSNTHTYCHELEGVVVLIRYFHTKCNTIKSPNINNPKGYNMYYLLKKCGCKCHDDGKFHVCVVCNCQELCDEVNYIGIERID